MRLDLKLLSFCIALNKGALNSMGVGRSGVYQPAPWGAGHPIWAPCHLWLGGYSGLTPKVVGAP